MSQSSHGTEKLLGEADDIRLNLIVTSPGDELRRSYGARPVVVAKVRFDNGQCIVNAGVGREARQALCNLGNANPSPYVEEVVSILVLFLTSCHLLFCRVLAIRSRPVRAADAARMARVRDEQSHPMSRFDPAAGV